MSQPYQPALGLSSHNNHYLFFSDHYLNEILRRSPAWQEAREPARALLAWLREVYAREQAQLPQYNESQLEDNWFKSILERLGHAWEGQATIPGLGGGIKKPDFVFFPDEAARQAAERLTQDEAPSMEKVLPAIVNTIGDSQDNVVIDNRLKKGSLAKRFNRPNSGPLCNSALPK